MFRNLFEGNFWATYVIALAVAVCVIRLPCHAQALTFTEAIMGTWTGTLTLEGEEAHNIVMEFMEDGNFTLTPEGDVPAKGTYEIDDEGNLTGEFAVEEYGITSKMIGFVEPYVGMIIKGEIAMIVEDSLGLLGVEKTLGGEFEVSSNVIGLFRSIYNLLPCEIRDSYCKWVLENF